MTGSLSEAENTGLGFIDGGAAGLGSLDFDTVRSQGMSIEDELSSQR